MKKTFLLLTLLLCSIGQMWAGEGFYDIYMSYTLNNGSYGKMWNEIDNNWDLGLLTSDFSIDNIYFMVWWENWSPTMTAQIVYEKDNGDTQYGMWTNTTQEKGGNNREVYNTSKFLWAQTNETPGEHTISYKFATYFSTVEHDLPESGNYSITYTIPAATITVGNGGYSTFCSSSALKVNADNQVYTATISGSTITLHSVAAGTVIPAGTGVIIAGEAGSKVYLLQTNESGTPLSNNNLLGTTSATEYDAVGGTMYCLKANTNEFHPVTSGTLAEGKAYFVLQNAQSPLRIVTPDYVPTSIKDNTINNVTKSVVNGRIVILRNNQKFDINGRIIK